MKTSPSSNTFEHKETSNDLISPIWIQKAFSSVYGHSKSVNLESVKLEKAQNGVQIVKVTKISEYSSHHCIFIGFEFPFNKDPPPPLSCIKRIKIGTSDWQKRANNFFLYQFSDDSGANFDWIIKHHVSNKQLDKEIFIINKLGPKLRK